MDDWRWREKEVEPDNPLALLRGCLLRTIGWLTLAGLLLGTGYIAVMALLRLSAGSRLPGGTLGYFIGAGMLQGAITGLVAGITTALALAAPVLISNALGRPIRRSRLLFGTIGAICTVLVVWGGQRLFGVPYPLLAAGPGDVTLGLALAGLGGWWVGDRVARWYLSETIR